MLFKLVIIVIIFIECTVALNDFNLKYKCKLVESSKSSLKCNPINQTTINIQLNTDIVDLDLSKNSLETLTFNSDTRLNKLLLSQNRFNQINEQFFVNLASLNELDLSSNRIEKMNEMTFKNFHSSLTNLNLSQAFVDSYVFTRELCELISLKVVDLSYLDLNNFTLKCWSSSSAGNLEAFYARNTRNIEKSWNEWYPFIGTKLKLIDLTNSNLKSIDPLIKQPLLQHVILANNKQIEKTALFKLLNTDNLIGRLITLNIANTSTSSKSLADIFDSSHNATLKLKYLDLSCNNITDDLNAFLFNQPKLKQLISFRACNNNFTTCNEKLTTINNRSLLESLEEIDLSWNNIGNITCLQSVRSVKSLKVINLSHNKLHALKSDLVDLIGLFADMSNITSIDLSYNSFNLLSFYFNQFSSHTKINKFDLSNNNLKQFRFISQTRKDSAKFPQNIIDEFDDYAGFDENDTEDDTDTVVVDNKHDVDDDDERFILINDLNLSNNKFDQIDLQHVLQSVRNVKNVDLSHNPISKLVGLSDQKLTINDVNKFSEDEFTEILCIDELDLSFCKLEHLPNLEHVCINKLNFAYNNLNNSFALLISKFSTYFIDYINLQFNDIKHISIKAMSNQVFKQDYYKHKNSPTSYYLGETNSSGNLVHTYIDLQNNKNYKCNCDEIVNLKQTYFIQILNECLNDSKFKQQCTDDTRITILSLNKKFRIIFVITCGLLMLLSGLIVYYMCSDCIRNYTPYDCFRHNLRKFSNRLRDLKRYIFTMNINSNNTNYNEESSSNVVYSKLDNDLIASTNSINNNNNNNNNNNIDA